MKDIKEKLGGMNKKIFILIGIFLVVISIILFGGAYIYNRYFYKRSYSEVEDIMLKTAKAHMNKNKDKLPININESLTISASDLARNKEMSEISEYIKDDSVTCNGTVTVTNINQTYRYTPYLDCGDAYKTSKFIDYIKVHHPIVENGNGLYNLNDQLVFRGDNVNNYLKLYGKIYRIVKFVDDSAVIIYTEKTEARNWDNRYNIDKDSDVGINDYSVSRIRDYLNRLYQSNTVLGVDSETGINSRNLVIAYPLEIGKRNSKDVDFTGKLEKGAIIENQFIGLLPMYDFLNASLDKNCNVSDAPSCINYNYLARFQYSWWTATATNRNSYNIFNISDGISFTRASSSAQVRHVFHLAKDAMYVSGDGTFEKPYIVK